MADPAPTPPPVKWWANAKIARTLGRLTWGVLVAGFVLGTRFSDVAGLRFVLPVALVVVVAVMSFPTALGLSKSRQHQHTRAFRLVLFVLLARLAATGWVVFMLLR